MKNSLQSLLAVALFSSLILAGGAQAGVVDDFNRPDGPLGANWAVQAGTCAVVSNQASCTGQSLATYTGGTGITVEADVFDTGAGLAYTALVLGYADLADSLYIKVQDSGGGEFDTYGLYFGVNGINNPAWSTGEIFNSLTTPFSSAHMIVSLSGDTVTLSLDTNFDSVIDQVYTASGVPLGLLGTGVGIGGLNSDTSLDNFAVAGLGAIGGGSTGVPEAPTVALLGGGLLLLGFAGLRRRSQAIC